MAYSVDFRQCVVRNISEGKSWEEVGEIFAISVDTIGRWVKMAKNGSLADAPRKEYKPKKIDKSMLKAEIEKNPDATLEELAEKFNCWGQSIHKRLVKMGITRKKNYAVCRTKRGKKASISSGD